MANHCRLILSSPRSWVWGLAESFPESSPASLGSAYLCCIHLSLRAEDLFFTQSSSHVYHSYGLMEFDVVADQFPILRCSLDQTEHE
jgi:hypothetical protein